MYRTLICSPDSSTWMKPATSLRTTDRGRISTVCLRVATSRRSEEHTSELQSPCNLVCRLLLEKKKKNIFTHSLSCPCIHIILHIYIIPFLLSPHFSPYNCLTNYSGSSSITLNHLHTTPLRPSS